MVYGRFTNRGLVHCHNNNNNNLSLFCWKPKTTVPLQDKESAPLLRWLNSVTEDGAHKRVERAKDQASGSSMSPARTSIVRLESSVVVVGHPGWPKAAWNTWWRVHETLIFQEYGHQEKTWTPLLWQLTRENRELPDAKRTFFAISWTKTVGKIIPRHKISKNFKYF